MSTFNLLEFLWQVSVVMALITFLYGLINRSWVSMLISFTTSLPFAYYFNGAENVWRLVALTPIVLLSITLYFWKMDKKQKHRLYTR